MTNSIGAEPGESEYGWGRGLQSPESKGHVPTEYEQMRAIYATNPADANSVADPVADGFVRE